MKNYYNKALLIALITFLGSQFNVLQAAKNLGAEETENSDAEETEDSKDSLSFSDRPESCELSDLALRIMIPMSPKQVFFLSLDGYTKLSDETIEAFVKKWPNLRSISLDGCTGLTDQTLLYINNYCTQLQSLTLTKCKNIQDDTALKILVRQNKNLKYLNLSKTPLASPTIKNALIAINSNLKVDI